MGNLTIQEVCGRPLFVAVLLSPPPTTILTADHIRHGTVLPTNLVKSRSHEMWIWSYPGAMQFGKRLGSTAAETFVKFQSDIIILSHSLTASRINEIWRSDHLTDPNINHGIARGGRQSWPHHSKLNGMRQFRINKQINAWSETISFMACINFK